MAVSAQEFSQAANIEVAPMQGETVLFNPQSDKFCLLNPTAALVWSQLQKPVTASQIVGELCKVYQDADEASVSRDVEKVLHEMEALAFVVAK